MCMFLKLPEEDNMPYESLHPVFPSWESHKHFLQPSSSTRFSPESGLQAQLWQETPRGPALDGAEQFWVWASQGPAASYMTQVDDNGVWGAVVTSTPHCPQQASRKAGQLLPHLPTSGEKLEILIKLFTSNVGN